MKLGKSIQELAIELQRRADSKADYVADTRQLAVSMDAKSINIEDSEFAIDQHTRRQITSHYKIPAAYSDLMEREAPGLLSGNINHWFQQKPARRMVRTLDGNARAFVSDKFFRYDNDVLAQAVLPVMLENPELKIESCEVTDKKMYIKALMPKMEGSIGLNDPVQAGLVISNSEIGAGSVQVQPLIYRLVCLNGMIMPDRGVSRYHVGRRIAGDGADVQELFRNETLRADQHALSLKLQDVVRAAMSKVEFEKIVADLNEAASSDQVVKPIAAVEILGKNIGLAEGERNTVLENLIKGQDYSKWGMANAVTAVANSHESYDRATELELLGGKVIDLSPSQWEEVAIAA
jgi:hypothetical protein